MSRLAFAIAVLAVSQLSGEAWPQPPSAFRLPSGDPFRSCWDDANVHAGPLASLEVEGAPLKWPGNQDRLNLGLRFTNKSEHALWLNKRAAIGVFPEFDTDISIKLKPMIGAPVKAMHPVKDLGRWAEPSDYVVVRAGQSIEMHTSIDRHDYLIGAGEFAMTLCLWDRWDRNPNPPAPPAGTVRFDQPLRTVPVRLIREAPPPGAKR